MTTSISHKGQRSTKKTICIFLLFEDHGSIYIYSWYCLNIMGNSFQLFIEFFCDWSAVKMLRWRWLLFELEWNNVCGRELCKSDARNCCLCKISPKFTSCLSSKVTVPHALFSCSWRQHELWKESEVVMKCNCGSGHRTRIVWNPMSCTYSVPSQSQWFIVWQIHHDSMWWTVEKLYDGGKHQLCQQCFGGQFLPFDFCLVWLFLCVRARASVVWKVHLFVTVISVLDAYNDRLSVTSICKQTVAGLSVTNIL